MNSNEKVASEIVNRNRHSRFTDNRNEMTLRIKLCAMVVLLAIISSVGFTASAANADYYNTHNHWGALRCAEPMPITDVLRVDAYIQTEYPGQMIWLKIGFYNGGKVWTTSNFQLIPSSRDYTKIQWSVADMNGADTVVQVWALYYWQNANGTWEGSTRWDEAVYTAGTSGCAIQHSTAPVAICLQFCKV